MIVKKQLAIATLGMMLSAPVAFAEEQDSDHEAHHPEAQETTESGSETAGGETMPGGQSGGMMGKGMMHGHYQNVLDRLNRIEKRQIIMETMLRELLLGR
jgi:hypothetical protein